MANRKHLLKAICAAAVVSAFACLNTTAVEIPLGGGVITTEGRVEGETTAKFTGAGIAYVDIELIFNEHPMTGRLKSEFEAVVEKKRAELADGEKAIASLSAIVVSTTTRIDNLRKEVEAMKKALDEKPAQPQTIMLPGTTYTITVMPMSGAPAVKADPEIIAAKESEIKTLEEDVEKAKIELSKRREELSLLRKKDKDEVVRLEAEHTLSVLNDIYKVLESVSVEENLMIVLDKNNVLYGQAKQDLTPRVLERMRGR